MEWLSAGPTEYELDAFIFPFLELQERIIDGTNSDFVIDVNFPIQKFHLNIIGSCFLGAFVVLTLSAPYLLLDVRYHHKNDDWEAIISLVDRIIGEPDVKIEVPDTLAGDYLAMELIKSTGANSEIVYRSNYLEYFTQLINYSSHEPFVVNYFLKFFYSLTKVEIAGNTMNENKLRECHLQSVGTSDAFNLLYTNLFSKLKKAVFYKDVKHDNLFAPINDLSHLRRNEENFIGFYDDIHFWSMSLVSKGNDTLANVRMCAPTNEVIKIENFMKLVSDNGKKFIKNLGREQLPYWMNIYHQYNIPTLNDKSLPFLRIEPPYYKELLDILKQVRSNTEMLKKSILRVPIPIQEAHMALNPNTAVSNIPIFAELFPTTEKDDHYDVTGILFGHTNPIELLDFRDGLPTFRGHPAQMKFIDECVKDIQTTLDRVLRMISSGEAQEIIKKNYHSLQGFLRQLFIGFCAHKFDFSKAKLFPLKETEGHAVTLFRSYDKKRWYHTSNQYILPIKNINNILYAYREELLVAYQLSNVGQHEVHANTWKAFFGNAKNTWWSYIRSIQLY